MTVKKKKYNFIKYVLYVVVALVKVLQMPQRRPLREAVPIIHGGFCVNRIQVTGDPGDSWASICDCVPDGSGKFSAQPYVCVWPGWGRGWWWLGGGIPGACFLKTGTVGWM